MDKHIEIQIPQDYVQKNVAEQLGNLMVQICIKDAIIKKLTEDNDLLRTAAKLAGAVGPIRPVPGHNNSEVQ